MPGYGFVKKALKSVDTAEVRSSERKEFTSKFGRFMKASERLEKVDKKWGKAQGDFSARVNDATGTLEKGQRAVADYSKAKGELEEFLKKLPNAAAFISETARALGDKFGAGNTPLAGKAADKLRGIGSELESAATEAAKKLVRESSVGQYSQAVALEAGLPEAKARNFALLVIKHGADFEKEANWKPLLEFINGLSDEDIGKLRDAAIHSETKTPGVNLFHMLDFVRIRGEEAKMRSPIYKKQE